MLFALTSPWLMLLFALFATAILCLSRPVANVLSVFIFSYVHIIVTSRIVAVFQSISEQTAWLPVQILLVAAVFAVWHWRGRPRPLLKISLPVIRLAGLKMLIKKHPVALTLLLTTVAAYAVLAGLILYVPPNNWDGMTYRLPRVMFWLQFDSFAPFAIANARIIAFPPNHEIGMMWTILLSGDASLAGFIQWVSAIVTSLVIYDLTRILGERRKQALIVACLWATLPMMLLQGSSIQNDHIVTAFAITGVYGLYYGLKHNETNALLLSGLGIGLGLGTKLTIGFLLPGLAMTALLLYLRQPTRFFKPLLKWAACSMLGFGLFGAYTYVVNAAAYGHVLGPEQQQVESNMGQVDRLAHKSSLYLFHFIDFAGVPHRFAEPMSQTKLDVITRLFSPSEDWLQKAATVPGDIVGEDRSWFGVIGFLVFLPGLIYGVIVGLRRRDIYMPGLVIMAVSFFLVHTVAIEWLPWRGRYHIMMVAVAAPLMVWLFQSRTGWMRGLQWLIVGLVVVSSVVVLTTNPRKPLIGTFSIPSNDFDRLERFLIEKRSMVSPMRAFSDVVPDDGVVRVFFDGGNQWLYPYWFDSHSRVLVPVTGDFASLEDVAAAQVDFLAGTAERHYLPSDFILIDEAALSRIRDTSGFRQVLETEPGVFLYQRTESD
jgi:4-amino-4-deoxy-L-arabinose transferase-like glycosyltransferase